jgi:hypothetical protein
MSDDLYKVAGVNVAPAGTVTTVEAVVVKADGSRVDYGVIASSHPDYVPLSARPEGKA